MLRIRVSANKKTTSGETRAVFFFAVHNFLRKSDVIVGMTGFEPATTRPPDEYSTGLSYIPKRGSKLSDFPRIFAIRVNCSLAFVILAHF